MGVEDGREEGTVRLFLLFSKYSQVENLLFLHVYHLTTHVTLDHTVLRHRKTFVAIVASASCVHPYGRMFDNIFTFLDHQLRHCNNHFIQQVNPTNPSPFSSSANQASSQPSQQQNKQSKYASANRTPSYSTKTIDR